MREILFRGKRVDNGEWVQGYVYQIWESVYILWGMTNGVPNMIEVIPETVGQYTGITDVNGEKIFEGDIIKWQYECREKYQVVFEDGHFIGVKEYGFISLYDTDFAVIGNIHEQGVQ